MENAVRVYRSLGISTPKGGTFWKTRIYKFVRKVRIRIWSKKGPEAVKNTVQFVRLRYQRFTANYREIGPSFGRRSGLRRRPKAAPQAGVRAGRGGPGVREEVGRIGEDFGGLEGRLAKLGFCTGAIAPLEDIRGLLEGPERSGGFGEAADVKSWRPKAAR